MSEEINESQQTETTLEVSKKIISLKTLNGEVLSGEFLGQKEEYAIPIFQFITDELIYSVPINLCEWWAIGDESAQAVKKRIFEEMKRNARELLIEERKQQLAKRQQLEDYSEAFVGDDSDEDSHRLTKQAMEDRTGFQGSLQAIAQHQQRLSQPESVQIMQPGDQRQKRSLQGQSSKHSMSRLPDDQEDL